MDSDNEVIEFIYERMVKLMQPVSRVPIAFSGVVSKWLMPDSHMRGDVNIVLSYDRESMVKVVRLLYSFAHFMRPKPGVSLKTNLHEFIEFLQNVDDDFVGYITVHCSPLEYKGREVSKYYSARLIRFSVEMDGIDVFHGDRVCSATESAAVRARWSQICGDHGYSYNFGGLVGHTSNFSLCVFRMDYLKLIHVNGHTF